MLISVCLWGKMLDVEFCLHRGEEKLSTLRTMTDWSIHISSTLTCNYVIWVLASASSLIGQIRTNTNYYDNDSNYRLIN